MFIRKLWRGEYSPTRTYWLFNVLLGAVLGAPISVIGSLPPETLAKAYFPSLIYFVLYFAYIFIASIGLWHSASKNEKLGIWKFLAKAYSVISIAIIVISAGFLVQGLFFKNFSIGDTSYKVYSCLNPKAQTEEECKYTYVGNAKYSVSKDKSEVFQTYSLVNSSQQNITKLVNCVVIDSQNWQCGSPNDDKLDSSGSGLVVVNSIARSNNGVVSISDVYLIGVIKGKPMTQTIIKSQKLEKN